MRHISAIPAFSRPLAGHCVLLAEDESLEASDTEHVLTEAGARVLLAHNAYQASLVVRHHQLTAAVIDAELGPDTIACVCALLAHPPVPFLFMTTSGEPPGADWKHVPVARSSADAVVLVRTLAPAALQRRTL